ncbi:MAG: repeat:Bacterial transcriptional activator domain:Tetratricopeptide 4, partial [Chloroflexi bacterium]|nr:repeat:Bacterial transcriptional activator domain:Tetratricopeptide 4 [Chloroflexota bacterium]
TEMQARNNLRQTLHQLRHVLPDADRFLYGDVHTLRWHEDASFSLDVAAFEHALARADTAEHLHDPSAWRSALEEAVALYRADLLPSCYDEWIVPERERLRQRYLAALAVLVRLLEAQRDYASAIRHAQSWIRYDPLTEDAYRALMHLLAQSDDRAGALRTYRTCARILQRELGVEPSETTRQVYERLLHVEALPPVIPVNNQLTATVPALIGRQQEWELLRTAWQQANSGQPRCALVRGDAGIGKTRLAEELLAWASRQGVAVARTRSYAAEGRLSLAPVSDLLRSERIRPHLARLDAVWLTEVSRIVPEVLAEHSGLPRPEPITEYGQRQRFFEALARAMLAGKPLMILVDDLQWCDQETLEWLHFLLRFDTTARLLVVGTIRDEELPADHPLRTFLLHLGNTVGLLEISLQPLDAAETARLAAQVVGRELHLDVVLRLYRQTEGNPLFVVETVRAGLGQASEDIPLEELDAEDPPRLPPRVFTVIAGRLAQLSGPAREVVGLAAAVGRAFTLDILLRAGHGDEESVVHALGELWNKRIVREQGANTYDFSHDKLREVAYAEISAPQRRLFHRRIAQAQEAANTDDLDPVSGQVAFHYEHAGMAEQAIPYYQRAAAVAQRVYANDDAIRLLSRGLELLEGLPAGVKRDTQELNLLLLLAPALRVTRGWTAPEAVHVLDRALELCDKVGDDGQRAQVLNGLLSVYLVQARFEEVQHISDRLDTLYQRSGSTMPPMYAELMLNGTRMHRGNLREANDRFTALNAVHDPDLMWRVQEAHGLNYMVHGRAWQGHALWCLGYPQSALTRARDAAQIARDLAQPFNQALAGAYLATLMQLCADDATARAQAEEALALATEYKASYYRAWSAILVGFALAWEQPDEEHVTRLRDSIAAFTATTARLRLPYYLSLLARVYGKAGRADEGLMAIEEALATSAAHNERWWDSELYRLRGELLLAQGARERDAEAALVRAIEVARAQQAKSLELRAATSLARLRVSQHRADDGRLLLADLCAWFTEGLDTPDVQAAQSLLASLA